MNQETKEKRNRQIGVIISIGSHVLILFLFLFVVAWRAPDPPLPEIGIELNFGLDDAGSGEVQPEPNTQPSVNEFEEEAKPEVMEESPEEIVDDVTETLDEPTETTDNPTEEIITPVNNTQESPDVVEEIPKEAEKEETKKEEEKPVTPTVLYPNTKPGSGGKDGNAKEAQNTNQGDKANVIGDQGDKEGIVDSRALYGNAGGGDGLMLQMSGWMWDFKPEPNDTSSESGKLVFQVIIDNKGTIIRVKTIESSVSPTLEKIYKDEVLKLTFSKTAGTSVATTSTGTITFVIKAR